MNTASDRDLTERKAALRRLMRAARDAVADSDKRSEQIVRHLEGHPDFRDASSIAYYVSVRSEVKTGRSLTRALESRDQVSRPEIVCVPFISDDKLELYEIRSMAELELGTFGVPEPASSIRDVAERKVSVADVQLIIVPGLAFDVTGGRIGYGRGYYDQLLKAATKATSMALAYECQLTDQVPMSPDDVRVEYLITEQRVIACQG